MQIPKCIKSAVFYVVYKIQVFVVLLIGWTSQLLGIIGIVSYSNHTPYFRIFKLIFLQWPPPGRLI